MPILAREMLLGDVVPFWTRHALDPSGALNTCIADDGRVLSRDRWGWSQWRAVWVFSRLFTAVEPRPEWLGIARGIHAFLARHAKLPGSHWALLTDGDGRVLRGFESVYVDGFAIYGLVELWRATRDESLLAEAMATFRAIEATPDPPPAFPYPIPPGRSAHGVSMLLSLVYHELAEATGDRGVRAAGDRHHARVMGTFLRGGVVREWVGGDESVVVPGHAIESMWFQIHVNPACLPAAAAAIRRHLELGWDREYGGLFLAVDVEGREEVAWKFADAKLWWPHTEALYATLLAHERTGEPWCLEWHERVLSYCLDRFVDREHGEWRQKLDRRGRPMEGVIALPVKDPFHLPRALILCSEILR